MQLLGGQFFIWINWLAMAVVYMIFLIGISIAVAKKHVFNRPLLLAIGMIVLLSLMTGGRGGIVNAIIFSLGGWLSVAAPKDLKYKKTIRRFFFIALIFFVILFIQFTNRAEGADLIIIKTFVKYFVGPIFAFDQLIITGIDNDIRSSIGRVGSALIGLDTIIVSGFARGVLGLQIESALASTSYFYQNGVNISSSEIMNAHYTGGARWYIDFGLAGYFLFFSLLASLCIYVDMEKARLVRRRVAFGYPIIYACVFVSVIYSTREFMFDSPEYYMAFGGLMVLYTIVKRKSRLFRRVRNNPTYSS
jgi:oligosaccharide repeat unit polymerase